MFFAFSYIKYRIFIERVIVILAQRTQDIDYGNHLKHGPPTYCVEK